MTLQPQYGLPGWDNNLPDWFIHAVKHSPDHWEWWFRLHPQMYKGRYDDEAQNLISILQQSQLLDKVEIDRSTQLPLYALLRHCDVHVTGHSSSVIEADQFGIPSIVTHINGAHYYQDQINHGLIVTAFTESELLGAIRSLCNHKRTTNRKTELGFYQQIKHTAAETIEALMQGAQTDNHIHVDDEEDVYIELLGINSCFEQIIHDFGNSRDVNRQMAVAKSYYQLGNMEQATRLYQECIDNIKSNNYNKVLSIPAIIELLGIYPNLAPNYQVKIAEMIRTTTENEVEIGLLLKELFRRDQHDWITRLASWHRDTCAVDVLFYTGRSYKSMGNYTESIRYLNDFTQILKNSKQAMGHTNSKSYLLSAYFHLGECFLLLLQNDKAIGAFQHCFELSDHTHNKAKAYIDQLMMQKI